MTKSTIKPVQLTQAQQILRQIWTQAGNGELEHLPPMPRNMAIRSRFLLYSERKAMAVDPTVDELLLESLQQLKLTIEAYGGGGEVAIFFRPAGDSLAFTLGELVGIQPDVPVSAPARVEESLRAVQAALESPETTKSNGFQEFAPNPFFQRKP